ncbi:LysR family transcriptional regulator [Hoeflea sp. G2-23]|uniref:LysR family transcriptional regulator n=1 Tax=Hoeflea algicola TaxID=2983763 RepID=A0ABT3ZBR5_9HYPH|nr:LysR family transcriptional regulator [Hoeflea algicola]MCY0149250.1 LysR family transcriptional regulator [Hoeflea algicola]
MSKKNKHTSIDLRQLGYFVAIADTGTISSAAARIGISQPSLSEMLARMENQLEVKLVVRRVRGTQLTDAGLALAKFSRDILRSVDLALDEVRHIGGEARGPVAIGLPPSVALLLSVPLAETVWADLPLVKLRIVESMSGYVLEWIENEHIDFGVVYQGLDVGHLDSQPLLSEELFLVTAPDNWPNAERIDGCAVEPIEFEKLAELPLVIPSRQHGLREVIERYARAHNLTLNIVMEIDALRHIVAMVSRASAYTILSHAAVMDEVARGELILVPVAKPVMKRTASIVRKRGRPITAASLAVENLFFSILHELIQRHNLRAELARMP